MKLEELLAEVDAMMETVEPVTVPVTLGKSTVGVRFIPMDGAGWRALTVQHPPRKNAPEDLNRGYNIDAVVGSYPDVVLIIGDQIDDMVRVGDDGVRKSIWPDTWSKLTATGRDDVSAEMWAAHELIPEKLVGDAGKALEG